MYLTRAIGLVGFLAATLVSGCITNSDAKRVYNYACPDGYTFSVEYSQDGDSLVLRDAEQERKLSRYRNSASGERYTDGEDFVFWSKGLMALIQENDESAHKDCVGDNN